MEQAAVISKYHRVHQQLLQRVRSGDYSPGHRLPSEKEMAQEYGVSVGTVVRALEALVREGVLTRRRGAGTFVGPAAGSVKPSLSGIVFVIPAATNVSEHSYQGPIFSALCDACFGQDIPLGITAAPPAEWPSLPERFPNRAFYFVSPPIDSLAALTVLWERRACFVAIGASWEGGAAFPTVDTDNRSGARRAVEYLLHQGHRRIALVNGEADSANCRDRQRGYEDALAEREITLNPDWIIPAGGSMGLSSVARSRLVDVLLARTAPTAIFCAGYYLALEVMEAVRLLGLSLPEQVSVIAVDDPRSAQYLQPPLTTLRQPLSEIGARGAARLLHLMRTGAPDVPLAEYLPAELVLRGSCVPPGNSPRVTEGH